MSNGIYRVQTNESRRWIALLLGAAALAVLSCALPRPAQFGNLLRAGPDQAAAGGPAGAAALVVASCVVWPLLLWGGAVLVLGAASRLPGVAGRRAGRVLRRVLPAALRPVLVAGLGVSIGVGTVACGTDAPAGTDSARVAAQEGDAAARADAAGRAAAGLLLDWPAAPGTAGIAVANLPELDWPAASTPSAPTPAAPTPAAPTPAAGTPQPSTPVAPALRPASDPSTEHRERSRPVATANHRTTTTGTSVIVRPGDTLWAIAAARLPAGADDAEIDRGWRAWYAANAAVIGPDPNLILPGQQLIPPTTKDIS